MIIYGWNTKNLQHAPLENYACKNCGEKDSFLAIASHYVHIFWIPLFPYKKSATISCQRCGSTFEQAGLPPEMNSKVEDIKTMVKTPKYLFSGLLLIVLGITWVLYSGFKEEQNQAEYLESPQSGDVFLLHDPNEPTGYKYYFLKVMDLNQDSLFVFVSNYSYDGPVEEMSEGDYFVMMPFSVHVDWLDSIREVGDLKKVFRGYSDKTGFNEMRFSEEMFEVDSLQSDQDYDSVLTISFE